MKILVTGASGFIGKNFLESTKHTELFTLSTSNICSDKIYKHFVGNLNDTSFFQSVLKERFDVIVHLAWIGLPQRTFSFNSQNASLYNSIMRLVSESETPKNVFIGSCLEYGSLTGEVSETSKGLEIDDFGKTKLGLCEMAQKSEISYDWLRLFYTYGPHQHSNSLINSIQRDLLRGNQITLNSPSLTHDFIYIKDVVELIDLICSVESSNSIYNVGSGMPTSTGQVANTICNLLNQKPIFAESQQEALTANISKVVNSTGWHPKFTLQDGIKATLSWREQ
jgi:nucleoside-diphosphate-sugar epimerase